MQNQYSLPDGHTLADLTNKLFSYLGNTDPELRDNIGYSVYANWLRMGLYSYDVILEHVSKLTNNLVNGIGEQDTDSVFIRSFSVLFLAEIIHNDNKALQINKAMISELVEKALWYLEYEKDPRGYIRDKGWAHALAHTADLLTVLAKNELSDGTQHLQMLNGITEKLGSVSDWVYVHGEDDRLAAAVFAIFTRGSLETDAIRGWLFSFTEKWKGAWMDEKRTTAFFNIRIFIRSLYLKLITEEELKHREELERIILETTQRLRPW